MLGQEIHLRDYVVFSIKFEMKRGRVTDFKDNKVSILSDRRYIIDRENCVIYNTIVSINPHLH